MQPAPVISVVMCTYNGEKYIDEQISSILNQTYKNFELIIADDVSTDNTYQKLLEWQAKDARIKAYKNPVNLGFNKNFEQAILKASGAYIAISDQDDIWLPEKLEILLKAFDDKNVVMAHNRSASLRGTEIDTKNYSLHKHYSGSDTRQFFLFNHINGHDMMFKKELATLAFPVPGKMFYDWWLAAYATTIGTIAGIDKTLVHHRLHDTNAYFTSTLKVNPAFPDRDEVLTHFLTISTLSPQAKKFLQTLQPMIVQQTLPGSSFNFKLFKFLFKHRQIIFGHKIKKLPLLSYTKNAVKYATMNYRGKGV